MTKNTERAKRIENVLLRYKHEELRESGPVCQDLVTDFLTDLRHWADAEEHNLARLDHRAHLHYLAEKGKTE